MQIRPLCFGLTGLGGFAGYACSRLLDASAAGNDSPARLLAVAEPRIERFRRRAEQLRDRGVRIVRSYRQLLDLPIDAVWLPLPIDLHRRFTERALAEGKAVLCEKPAAGCVDDVDAMIAARSASSAVALVGFQDVYQPSVAELKKRLLRGDLGAPIGASVIGCWPRDLHYFSRNNWAGRLRRRGRWVMDSPAGNALAHFLHLALFLLGQQFCDAAYPVEVAAELYRANPIESYDTCAMRYTIASGGREIPLVVAFTHACDTTIEPEVTLQCERGRIRYLAGRHAECCIGTHAEILPLQADPYPGLLASFRQHYDEQSSGGGSDGHPGALVATLESARAHVVAVNAAAEAAEIFDVPSQFVTEVQLDDHATPIRAIQGIVPALSALTGSGAASTDGLLHENGTLAWTHLAARMRIPPDYRHFAGPRAGALTAAAASEQLDQDEEWPIRPAESARPLGAQA